MVIKKVVVEIRHYPILKFRDVYPDVIQPLMEKYTALDESNSAVRLRDDGRYAALFHERLRSGISVENLSNQTEFTTELRRLMDLFERAKVRKAVRIGVRTWVLQEINALDYEDSIAKFLDKQVGSVLVDLDGMEVSDAAVTLEGSKDGQKIRLVSGVVNGAEVDSKVSEFKGFDSDPKISLLHDIDRYTSDQMDLPTSNFVEKMLKLNLELADECWEKSRDIFSSKSEKE